MLMKCFEKLFWELFKTLHCDEEQDQHFICWGSISRYSFKSFLKHFIVMKNKINTLFAEAQSAVTRSIY